MKKCYQCSGTGMVQTGFGPKPCPTCNGKGYIDETSDRPHNKPLIDTSDWSILEWAAVLLIVSSILYSLLH